MKIGILTFWGAGNYGGDLQAFALQKKLLVLGYDVEVIRQLRPINKEFVKTNNFKPIINLNDKTSIKSKIKSRLSKIIDSFLSFLFKKRNSKRLLVFSKFEKENINFSNKVLYNFDELYKEDFSYDVLIVGSDQVWNFTNGFSPEPYFLTFAKPNQKKISYAASIGHSTIPKEIAENYTKWIMSFDYISVREEQAEVQIKKLTQKDAITVLDPTLLFSKKEWLSFFPAKNVIKEPYLLIYSLSASQNIFKIAKAIAREKKLKIIRVVPRSWTLNPFGVVENIYDAGPIEFIQLFAGASFILTNSFHGTAFSINFKIPFYSVVRKNLKNISRFENILNKTKLMDRLRYDDKSCLKKELITSVDFSEAESLIRKEREKSIIFLTTALTN